MHAVILAAGFSTRLYPITEYFPKALLPYAGRTILSYSTDDLVRMQEITGITLVTNSRCYHLFSIWWKTAYPDYPVVMIDNGVREPDKRLGSIGDLLLAIRKERLNDDILVLASDVVSTIRLPAFVRFFSGHHGFVNAVCDMHDKAMISKRLGCAEVSRNKLTGFSEKPDCPKTTLTSIPFYIFPREILSLIDTYRKEDKPLDAPGSIIPWLIGKTPCYAYDIGKGFYYDVGTIADYNRLSANPELLGSIFRKKSSDRR